MKILTKRACTDRTSNLRATSPTPQKKLICNAIALCNNCFLSLDCLFVDITMCFQFNVPWDTSLRTTPQDVQAKPRSATQLRSTGRLCPKSISHKPRRTNRPDSGLTGLPSTLQKSTHCHSHLLPAMGGCHENAKLSNPCRLYRPSSPTLVGTGNPNPCKALCSMQLPKQ